MSDTEQIDLIDELLQRIERLELHETELQQEVNTLRQRVVETEEQLATQQIVEAEVVEPRRRQQTTVRVTDRDGRVLREGDPVYILTRGVHRERRGVIHTLGTDRVIVLDRTGVQQSRVPHNVRYTGEQ